MSIWRIVRVLGVGLVSISLAGSFCDSAPVEEEEEEVPAAERLQQPRNLYDGNVNENLRDLRDGIEEAGRDRQDAQDQRIREATGR